MIHGSSGLNDVLLLVLFSSLLMEAQLMCLCSKKEGDFITHFLFNIVAEGLSGLIREASSKNLFFWI